MDPYIVLGGAIVGLLVGSTGAGGGALMTPMLVLVFSVHPSTAISSDLVAALVMRPVGAAVHLGRRTVNLRLVGWMSAGSVPAAVVGSYLLHLLGASQVAQADVQRALGAALLLGGAGMLMRRALDARSGARRATPATDVPVRPLLTLAVGVVGGLVVGMTSVGAGSLMIVLLMFVYPTLDAGQMVGTDLTQAIPLTAAAALGALMFGHIAVPVSAAVVLGGVPGVLVGSLLSSRVPDRWLRPVITLMILGSGLKYVGLGTAQLGLALVLAVVVAITVTARRTRSGRRSSALAFASSRL